MIKFDSIRKMVSIVPALLTGVFTGGCTQEIATTEAVSESGEHLFRTGTTWANSMVNVCIDPTDDGGANRAALVAKAQRLLAATWSKATKLEFKGSSSAGGGQATWGTCAYASSENGNYSTVALHFCTATSTSAVCTKKDERGRLKYYAYDRQRPGYFIGYTDNGTSYVFGPVPYYTLNYQYGVTFTPGVVRVAVVGDDTDPFQTLYRHQVIHEFGHALGFRHEHDRDSNCYPGVPAEGTTYGRVDNDSIMSFCAEDALDSSDPEKHSVLLSGIDIWGARQVYGTRPSAHGFMILSDADPTLAVNAYGGATKDGILKMNRGCSITNADCTWTYQRGMLVSDSDPRLAIMRYKTSSGKYALKLAEASLRDDPPGTYPCTPANAECTWTYELGQFELDADRDYHLNARGGATHLADVGVSPACTATNGSCLWTLPNVMLTTDRDSSLPINAYGGAYNNKPLKLHQGCDTTNGSCTFTFTRGMIRATGNSSLAWRADGGAHDRGIVTISGSCTEADPACRWQWSKGRIASGDERIGRFVINAHDGGLHLHDILLQPEAACPSTHPDCVFSGYSAKN